MPSPGPDGKARAHEGAITVVEHAARTDVGREREGNEDSYLERPPLFAVADGMGGAAAGEIASGILVETLSAAYDAGGMPDALAAAIQEANGDIHSRARSDRELAGMGTTVTAAWVGDATLTIAHVGDSRCYRFRDGRFEQLTDDHSLVGGLVRLGELTKAEAERHPQRSVILRAVGVEAQVEVDVIEEELVDGDVYLICSDGLSGMVRDEVLEETLRAGAETPSTAEMLIDLANECGGHDNITAVLFRIGRA